MQTIDNAAAEPDSQPRANLLEVADLHAGYGPRDVLFGIDLAVRAGEIVTILGHNGAGKSTALKAIMGLIPTRRGTIHWRGEDITRVKPAGRVERGLAYSPQQGFVFPDLTIEQNLAMGQYVSRTDPGAVAHRDEVLQLFPILGERLRQRARNLSGGQQRMLGLAMAMSSKPTLLVLDELSLGISPRLFEDILAVLQSWAADNGASVLLVEQHIERALDVADRAVVVRNGSVVANSTSAELRASNDLWELF
jgi:branched-chain amino acid transport system ATP-binding protein